MKSLIKNSILPLFNFIIIGFAAYLLYLDFTATLQNSVTVQIGTITFKKRVAERKYTRQVIWEKLANNSPVYNFDAIRTDAGSLAVINLNDGTAIELEEETMVVLQQSQKGLDIDFEQGAISAKTSGSTQGGLNIKSGGAVVALASGDLNLQKSKDQSLNVNVQSGSAQLMAAGETTQIDSSKMATVTQSGTEVEDINIKLLSPAASKNIVAPGSAQVPFSWSLSGKNNSVLEVSRNRDFSSLIANQTFTTQSPSAAVSLPEGIFYWRVRSEGKSSPVRRIAIVTENRPIVLRPFKGQQFTYRDKRPLVTFKWNGAESAYAYRVEISNNSGMSSIVKKYQTYDTLVSTDELNDGTYYCRITALYNLGSEKKEVPSLVTEFTVSKNSQLSSPRLISPFNNKKLLVENSNTIFNWQKVTEASSYVITIKDKDSSRELVNSKVNNNFYSYSRRFSPGTYNWTVTSIAPDGTRSAAGSSFTFRVTSEGKIIPTAPASGKKFLSNERIHFTWKDENMGQKYQLQIARDSAFIRTTLRKPLNTRSATISDLNGGNYYWRINLLDSQNNSVLSSQPSRFTVIDRLSAPNLVSPGNKKFAHDTSALQFNWNRVPNATHYRIEIYRKGFPGSTQIESKLTRGTSFSINLKPLKDGDYFWTVQAFLRQGGKVVMKSSTSKNEFSKEKKEIPEITKPEIISPSTIYIQ